MEKVIVELFGKDPKVVEALEVARNLASVRTPVIIVGENGVGKRSLGAYIHMNSPRSVKDLVVVDCSLDAKDVENLILGYREPTGRFVKGAFESANGGTVLLANIDSMDESFQKRLFQIISELPDYDIDVRLVATTTKNLSKLVGAGRFYRGLYTLIAQQSISIPPLRERQGDLAMIARHYIDQLCPEGTINKIDQAVMDKIVGHYWSSNITELKQVILSSVSTENGEQTGDELTLGEKRVSNISVEEEGESISLMSLRDAEKLLIKKALVYTSENRTQAAKILGVSIRTLRNKINEYRLEGSAYFVNLR